MKDLALLAELNGEDSTMFVFHLDRVRSDHANLGLFGLATLRRRLLLGSFIFLRWIRVLVIGALKDYLQSELDFFRLHVRLALKVDLV